MSNQYNKTERIISGALSAFPGLKQAVKRTYQRLNYILYRKKQNFHSDFNLRHFDDAGRESFFGYYDHSPLNRSGKYLLFHSAMLSSHLKPDPAIPVDIVLYDFASGKSIQMFSSHAWNWQQGARTQWLDDKSFIFNDFDSSSDKYFSRIVHTEKPGSRRIDFPVYDCHGSFALGLNFDRLHLLRPDYGYANRKGNISPEELDDTKDGIFKIDLEKNNSRLLISLDELKRIDAPDSFQDAHHKVNHIMLSPSGKRFMFLHRWLKNGRRFNRLYVSDLDQINLKLLARNIVSHCYWRSENEIIGFFEGPGGKLAYHKADLPAGDISVLDEQLDQFGDGHPNINGNKMLTDTYPNKARMKELMLYDLEKKSIQKLGEFFESLKFIGETRCDLHPRWDCAGNYAFFDSVHTGKRKLYAIKYSNE